MLANHIVVIAGIGVICALCQWLAWKVKVPSILFLLLSGITVGPILGWLKPDQLMGDLLLPFISISVAIILFEGGLTLNLKEIKGYGAVVRNLITLGVLATWLMIALTVHFIFQLNWNIAFLFGAITVVTGPTVIKPLMRVVRPNAEVANVLQWEGILIDPIGAFLALLVFEFILSSTPGQAISHNIYILGKLIVTGTLVGAVSGYVFGIILRNYWVPEYLQNITTLATVVFIYMLSELVQHESGLLAATIMGIWLANMKNVWIKEIINFKESISILLISSLFILLAARLDLNLLPQFGWTILLFLAIAQFIIRPLSVWICTFGSKLNWRERALISWVSPRGIIAAAISSLFVIRLEEKAITQADAIVPLTFILIIGTVVFQSLTSKTVARFLNVSDPMPNGILIVGANKVSIAIDRALNQLGVRTILADSSWNNIQKARMSGLRTYFGNPTSAHADEHLDLIGIGKLVALSTRRETNALASIHYRPEFGLDSIYSLQNQPDEDQLDKHEPISKHQPNVLFSRDVNYNILREKLDMGAEVSHTKLTEIFNYEAYLQKYAANSVLMFAIDPNGVIHVYSDPLRFTPVKDWTIVRLGPSNSNNE